LANLALLRQHPEIREKLISLFSVERKFDKSDDVDTQLYDGFFSPADRAAMDIIRETDPNNLAALDIEFDDKRIKPLLFRYRARNFPG
ncbi:exodeoxyribonuclease I, partial [Escherichia coli]|nr:exodeoxyribonuclease I [Escherichia coli]